MPTITIESLSNVLLDGASIGAVADTIANNPNLASDIQQALVKYEEAGASELAALRAIKGSLDTGNVEEAILKAKTITTEEKKTRLQEEIASKHEEIAKLTIAEVAVMPGELPDKPKNNLIPTK